ncbi:MAG: bile acid:sodium symporter family protein [Planctomycetaceae bacterium]
MLKRSILLWLILSSLLAWFWPQWISGFDPFLACGPGAINVLIVVAMFAVGSLLPTAEVDLILRRWPVVLGGTATQYICMPLLAFLVVRWLRPDAETATGILIVGCVPGAMASNVLTVTARGNVSYSVSLTTLATLLSPIIVPLMLWLVIDRDVPYDGWKALRLMLLQIVLPVISGHCLSRFSGAFRNRAERQASGIANVAILSIIAIAVALNRSGVAQASGWLIAVLALINVCGYLSGYLGGTVLRLDEAMKRALTLEVGMQNAGAGVALAKELFGADSPALVPCILYTFGCMLTGTLLSTVWHSWSPNSLALPNSESGEASRES